MLLTVTGSVLHGPAVMRTGDNPNVDPSDLPRKFREVFVLRPVEAAEGMQPKVRFYLAFGEADQSVCDPERELPLHRLSTTSSLGP